MAACQTVCVVELTRVFTVTPETTTIFTTILQISDLRAQGCRAGQSWPGAGMGSDQAVCPQNCAHDRPTGWCLGTLVILALRKLEAHELLKRNTKKITI